MSCSSVSWICMVSILQNCFTDNLASDTICKNPSIITSSSTGIKLSPFFPSTGLPLLERLPSFSFPHEAFLRAFFSSSQYDSKFSNFFFNSPNEDLISDTSLRAASLF
uniref:Uncharacterized protein n=1 Tax=Opuntia streptacantha TaxID=393608 RepID=A0A7C9D4Q5_OPUST